MAGHVTLDMNDKHVIDTDADSVVLRLTDNKGHIRAYVEYIDDPKHPLVRVQCYDVTSVQAEGGAAVKRH